MVLDGQFFYTIVNSNSRNISLYKSPFTVSLDQAALTYFWVANRCYLEANLVDRRHVCEVTRRWLNVRRRLGWCTSCSTGICWAPTCILSGRFCSILSLVGSLLFLVFLYTIDQICFFKTVIFLDAKSVQDVLKLLDGQAAQIRGDLYWATLLSRLLPISRSWLWWLGCGLCTNSWRSSFSRLDWTETILQLVSHTVLTEEKSRDG